jgi:LysM repeat protein
MFKSVRRSIAAAVSALLVLIGLTALAPAKPAEALTGSMFDPGLIISDSVFFDFGTMSVAQIQAFLDSKVPICNANDGGPTCLRYYKMDTQSKAAETGRCTAMPAKKAQSAAQIIYDIARACGINPRVLIVLLQKEQGLIQASNPTSYMYRAATGYGCPDSRPDICGKGSVITGLFNQLHRAAGQFQWYGDPAGSFTYLKVGKNISMRYHPDACDARDANGNCTKWVNKCGSQTFQLKSQATANLYYYTPYVPNASALKNLYGSGDSCSAYGNRNFWRFYSDWFGSPIGGGFLLKSATSETFLIVDEKKYLIEDPELLASLSPLGPLGTISSTYLNSFKTSGSVTRLVKSATGTLYMIDQGKKFTVATCDLALSLSLDCAKAIVLTSSQLAALPTGGAATSLVVDADGSRYLIQNGSKRQILDDASLTAENIKLPAKSTVGLSAFEDIPWGQPIAKAGTTFVNKTTGNRGVFVGSMFYEIDSDMAKEVDFGKWFTKSTGTLTSAGLSAVYSNTKVRPIVNTVGGHFLITPTGKRALTNGADFVATAPVVNEAFVTAIPNAGIPIVSPLLVKQVGGGTLLIQGQQKRTIASRADLTALTSTLGPAVETFTKTALAQIQEGPVAFAPGSVLRAKSSKKLYYVDDYNRMVSFTSQGAFDVLGFSAPRTALDASIAANKQARYSGGAVRCNGLVWIPWFGALAQIDPDYVAQWPAKPLQLSAAACDRFVKSPEKVGQLVRDSETGEGFYILGGQKRKVTSQAIYNSLKAGKLGYLDVETALLNSIPTGPNAVAKPTPVTPGKTYTVVAGDSLGAIAARFKTTVAILKILNKLTSDVIRVGQVLTIP